GPTFRRFLTHGTTMGRESSKTCPHAVTVSSRKFLRSKLQPKAGLRARERRFETFIDPRLPELALSGMCGTLLAYRCGGSSGMAVHLHEAHGRRHRIPVSIAARADDHLGRPAS